VRFEDPGNRRTPDAMPDVLQGTLDPRVAPRGILLRHSYNQPPDLDEDAPTARGPGCVGPFPSNQLTMPPKQRIWRHDRGDLTQRPTAHPDGSHREAPSVVIGQMQAPPTQTSQEAVLFDQIGERLPLSAPSQPVRTVNSIWRADASITSARLYHSRSYRCPPQFGGLVGHNGSASPPGRNSGQK
jgi:hypothetical protein